MGLSVGARVHSSMELVLWFELGLGLGLGLSLLLGLGFGPGF